MENQNLNGLETFEHVVVLMLENRSFDNLLGHLYGPEKNEKWDIEKIPEGKSFEGLSINHPLSNPTAPFWDQFGLNNSELSNVTVNRSQDYHQPFPDPGEEFQHVNTQLFNQIDEANRGKGLEEMVSDNLPNPVPNPAGMKGFVNDYINTLLGMPDKADAKNYQPPSRKQFEVIMQCFMPDQVPVLSTLAREFAVFDHWFCSVPSQTWCNRAFWHAGTSGGFVNNPSIGPELPGVALFYLFDSWKINVKYKPNLLKRMESKGLTNRVYASQFPSLTSLIVGVPDISHPLAIPRSKGNNLSAFKNDLKDGKLPKYSFIEPKFMLHHNDQHPSSVNTGINFDSPFHETHPGTVLLGEDLIWEVYDSIFTNETYKENTLLIITYDEHGGCFDHVPPIEVTPPSSTIDTPKGQPKFDFKRSGARVPMVMVSANIQKNTIVNDPFDHTSFLKTMCKKWSLDGFTDRDKAANSFEQVFSGTKRSDFPTIPRPSFKAMDDKIAEQMPLNDLQKSILVASHVLKTQSLRLGAEKHAVDIHSIQTIGEAMTYLESIRDHLSD
ncbi:MAG: hypothetical protein HRT58_04435 [Crocinitomicaceae bacterium]|nr:hypothetical protein [Flavobacteriales bacterium]NQZ34884.1 hypothetical protein [Crocinitomicaceae bacterium]